MAGSCAAAVKKQLYVLLAPWRKEQAAQLLRLLARPSLYGPAASLQLLPEQHH